MARTLSALVLLLVGTVAGICLATDVSFLLFDAAPWAALIAGGLGLLLGVARAMSKADETVTEGEVTRHGVGAFFEHWGSAIGILVLAVSGLMLGFLSVSGQAATPGEAALPLNLHFVGLMVALVCGSCFVGDFLVSDRENALMPTWEDIVEGTVKKYLLRAKWYAEDKYLSSQKSAFLAFAVLGAFMLVSGGIKLASHTLSIQAGILRIATVVHDVAGIAFVALVIVHVVLVLVSERHLLVPWLTGKVPESYVETEHPVWRARLTQRGAASQSDGEETTLEV
jgi:cytochrome b subunit of formate dehydrogenase